MQNPCTASNQKYIKFREKHANNDVQKKKSFHKAWDTKFS